MTAETNIMNDVPLLPLPEPRGDVAEGGLDWTDEEMQAYARANVANVTAVKAVEITWLRGEVGRLNDLCNGLHRSLLDSQAGYVHYRDRAERLAEALREARECGNDGDWQSTRRIIDAALEQEAIQLYGG